MNAPVGDTALLLAVLAVVAALLPASSFALGSSATLAIAYGSSAVCGLAASSSPRGAVVCASASSNSSLTSFLAPNASFSSVSGGRGYLCGLTADGTQFYCWNAAAASSFPVKRVYKGPDVLADLAVGDYHIAAVDRNTSAIRWWRAGRAFPTYPVKGDFNSLTSGNGFSCAVDAAGAVHCWGPNGTAIQSAFGNISMASVTAGDSHVCGLDTSGRLLCKGRNSSGQAQPPASSSPFQFTSLALGSSHSCALRQPNKTAVCWGGAAAATAGGSYAPAGDTEFEFLVAGGNLTCGLTTAKFSVTCWRSDAVNASSSVLPTILPGPCVADEKDCSCGVYPDSTALCSSSGSGSSVICKRCDEGSSFSASPPPATTPTGSQSSPPPAEELRPPPSSSSSKRVNGGWIAFAVVGGVGIFSGICSLAYCLLFGLCRQNKVHNSVQPTIATAGGRNGGSPNAATIAVNDLSVAAGPPFISPSGSRSRAFRRQRSWPIVQRQRSGPSTLKERGEEFTFAELSAAANGFAAESKIGAGSFGTVYKGRLPDGREVAIKRSEPGGPKNQQRLPEKESAFRSELSFLSRLHHKHLVGLVGYCDEGTERLLVYEYMKNGAFYDHLHPPDGAGEASSSPVLSSWKMRIKALLDASRGIEYLHSYAVPPIIHRDIKSSNILLDGNWVARVSDFGLSLMGPAGGEGHVPARAVGTVGYMDPEYYGLRHLTVKSDVYGFGVVMLEALTGRRAIFKEAGGALVSVVDYAVPSIVAGELGRVLDGRAGEVVAGTQEAEALELVAYTAVHCVRLEGRERPMMADVVANLETALALCSQGSRSHSHASISSASFSVASQD